MSITLRLFVSMLLDAVIVLHQLICDGSVDYVITWGVLMTDYLSANLIIKPLP